MSIKKKEGNSKIADSDELKKNNNLQLFSIIISMVMSAIAIGVSLNANNLAREQIRKENIPLWDYKIISESKFTETFIQFTSLKTGFKIQNLEIITPAFLKTKKTIKTENDIWNHYEFQQDLLKRSLELYKIPDVITDEIAPSSYRDTYPISLKINYIKDGKIYDNTSIYIVRFKVFGASKLNVKSLTLLSNIEESNENIVATKLDYLNKTEYMEKPIFAYSEELFSKFKSSDTLIREYVGILVFAGDKYVARQKYLKNDSSKKELVYLEYTIPLLLSDSNYYKYFTKKMDSIKQNISYKNDILITSIAKVDSFLKKNPPCFDPSYNTMTNCSWLSSITFNNWEELLENDRIRIWKSLN